ncbi:transposase [Bradyrhizobium sp.]|uniref:transposase n=1 Tax=Bradyrhizobium sp. TaxID=376 RepID=UPI003966B9AC
MDGGRPTAQAAAVRAPIDFRTILNAIRYILATGCQQHVLPTGLPPGSTVQGYFYRRARMATWRWFKVRQVR